MEVSWQLTGIRHDPFAHEDRIPTEAWKEGFYQGKYLNTKVREKAGGS